MKISTLGFTKISAETFFARLQSAGVKRLIDVRLNNVSQLAGFTKRDDLAYFTKKHGIEYVHMPQLAPTTDILNHFKKNGGSWKEYEVAFRGLMKEREVEKIAPDILDDGCLLCSEDTPHNCHRRLVAEYLHEHWGNVDINHL